MTRRMDEYEVESVIGKRGVGESAEYLIKWKGYPKEQSTWEPIQNLQKVRDLVSRFNENKHTGRKSKGDQSTSAEYVAEKKNPEPRQYPLNALEMSENEDEESSVELPQAGFVEEVKLANREAARRVNRQARRQPPPKPSVRGKLPASKYARRSQAKEPEVAKSPLQKRVNTSVVAKSAATAETQIGAAKEVTDHFEMKNEIYLKLDLPTTSKFKPTVVTYAAVEQYRPALIASYFKKLIQNSLP